MKERDVRRGPKRNCTILRGEPAGHPARITPLPGSRRPPKVRAPCPHTPTQGYAICRQRGVAWMEPVALQSYAVPFGFRILPRWPVFCGTEAVPR